MSEQLIRVLEAENIELREANVQLRAEVERLRKALREIKDSCVDSRAGRIASAALGNDKPTFPEGYHDADCACYKQRNPECPVHKEREK